jgi:hypothetical protein
MTYARSHGTQNPPPTQAARQAEVQHQQQRSNYIRQQQQQQQPRPQPNPRTVSSQNVAVLIVETSCSESGYLGELGAAAEASEEVFESGRS